jgi:hypothetical protein
MKVITHYVCPPIPVRCADWVAYFDGQEEAGICGHGATEIEALRNLLWQTVYRQEAHAVQDALDKLEAA